MAPTTDDHPPDTNHDLTEPLTWAAQQLRARARTTLDHAHDEEHFGFLVVATITGKRAVRDLAAAQLIEALIPTSGDQS